MSRRIFKPGRKVRTMTEIERAIWQGQYLYLHQKPIHPGWLASMQFRTIATFLRSGWIRRAEVNS